MKKILLSIITLLLSFSVISKVEAKSYDIVLNGNNSFEEEITITLQITNQKEMSSYCNGICGLMATLKYDSSKIELTKVTESNDFEITYNEKDGTIIIERDSGANDGTNIGTLKFRNKSLNNEESTSISLDNITGTDGENDISTKNISKTIKYIKKENTNTNTNTKPNSNTNTNVNNNKQEEVKKKSNNNYLSKLNIDLIDIEFDKNKLIYDLVVKYDINKINIKAQQEDKNATIDGVGEYELKVGKNSIKLLVTAEDETTREYTININREEQNIVIEDNKTDTIINEDNNKNSNNNNKYYYIILSIVIILIISSIFLFKRKK